MSSNTSPDLAQPSESTPPLESGPRSRPAASERAAFEPSRSYLHCALTTSLNIALHVLSGGRFIWLEGRVSRGRFSNWLRRFRHRPRRVAEPRSERELVELVQAEPALRVFGAGHSFNGGVVSHDTLVSLDRYAGVIELDRANKRVTVRGGTRVRDVSRFLLREGLALENLPSHDAQSVAGILSSDVHGTGRDWGFVSAAVTRIKLVDGTGTVHTCGPDDELFRAAIGGIGAVGVISEVTLEVVERFDVQQKVELSSWSWVKEHLDELLQQNEHMSLYLFPFTDRCQVNTWNATHEAKSYAGPLRELLTTSLDALLAAWLGNLLAYSGLFPRLSDLVHRVKRGTNLVLESYEAFNRSIYHLHQELEFAVDFARTVEACERFRSLYERMQLEGDRLPYVILEVRFTPGGHQRTLIGPGRERRSTWIDLLANDSHGFERYFAAAEELMRDVDARPHPGKYNESFDEADLLRLHGSRYRRFVELAAQHDPRQKFVNAFTRRLFGARS
jgi:hypothetical protein